MKTKYVHVVAAMLISVSSFAQKEELKSMKKIFNKEVPSASEILEYKANLTKLETLSVEEADKVYTNFYKAMLPIKEVNALGKNVTPQQIAKLMTVNNVTALTTGLNETLAYEKKTGKKVYTDNIIATVAAYKPTLLSYAVELGNNKQFKESSTVLYNIYLLDKNDVENLYYAASYAVNAQDYQTSLDYYNELIKLNYSGEKTIFWAKNLSGKEETFPTKAERDRYVSLKTHDEPRDEKIPSRRGEIYKNIALIYVQKGQVDEAKKAIIAARISNPDDTSLILTEANLYLESKDFVTYKKLITEALVKNPNDADLYYNLGVISLNNKEYAEAEKHYLKAIEIDPKYANAYLNLAILKLDPEKALIEQMNKLSTSAADNKKYEIMKKQRLDIFGSAIPYLEKAVALDAKNLDAARTLLNVYNALEITEKAKPLKAKIKEMEAK